MNDITTVATEQAPPAGLAPTGTAGIALGPADDHPLPTLRSFAARRIEKLQPRGPGGRSGAVLQTNAQLRGKSHRARPLSGRDPSAYATQLLARIRPSVLPYELDTPASFSFAAFNGRGLCDDVMDVILTLVTNTALGDGVAPDIRLMRPDFPYFGEPYPTSASSAKQ